MKKGGLDFPVPDIEKCEARGACIRACPFSDGFDEDGDLMGQCRSFKCCTRGLIRAIFIEIAVCRRHALYKCLTTRQNSFIMKVLLWGRKGFDGDCEPW